MKFLKNILLLSAIFVAAASFACAEDGLSCDRSFTDVEVSHVKQGENTSPLHKLMLARPGQLLFIQNWPTDESVDANIKVLQSHIDSVFAPFIAEISEEKEFISDVASLLKKYLVVIFRNSSRLALKQYVNELVGGDSSRGDILLGDVDAAECAASGLALKNVWDVAVEDILAVLKKNKPSYDSAKLEALLRMVIDQIKAQMAGGEGKDLSAKEQLEAIAVFMDFKQNVLSYFSDEDLMSIQEAIQDIDSIVDSSSVASLSGRNIQDFSVNQINNFTNFVAYDFSSNTVYTHLPIVRDDLLESEVGFTILPTYDADGNAVDLHMPSSVTVVEKNVCSEPGVMIWGVPQNPRMIKVFNKLSFDSVAQNENDADFDESVEVEESSDIKFL